MIECMRENRMRVLKKVFRVLSPLNCVNQFYNQKNLGLEALFQVHKITNKLKETKLKINALPHFLRPKPFKAFSHYDVV